MNKVPILQHDFSRRFGDVNSDDASVNSQQFSLHCKHVYHLQAVSGKTVSLHYYTDGYQGVQCLEGVFDYIANCEISTILMWQSCHGLWTDISFILSIALYFR